MKHHKIIFFNLAIVSFIFIICSFVLAEESMHCVQDSDCGVAHYIGTEYCFLNNVYKDKLVPSCINPQEETSHCVSNTIKDLIFECNDIIGNWSANYCKDGNSYHSRYMTDSVCKVFEYDIAGCDNSNMSFQEEIVEICLDGCDSQTGNCIIRDKTCHSDNDCLAGEFCEYTDCSYNLGECVIIPEVCLAIYDPVCGCDGVTYSNDCFSRMSKATKDHDGECVYICTQDSDCGTNGFIGNGACNLNDVFKNYVTYTCNNPGTLNSHCSNLSVSQLFLDCGESGCGEYGDEYCYGKDLYKSRTCHDKGCCDGLCYNNIRTEKLLYQECLYGCSLNECISPPTICTKDSDCGIDTYTGDKYCKDDDVYRDYIEYKCLNPGLDNSTCEPDSNPRLIEECEDYCKDGECVEHHVPVEDGFDDMNKTEYKKYYSYYGGANYTNLEISPTVQRLTTSESKSSVNVTIPWYIILIIIIVVVIFVVILLLTR
jgi:hypothetical protein